MRVLLAGATGVIGRAVVPRLVAHGHRVTAVSRREPSDRALVRDGAEPVRLDLFDTAAVRGAARDVDAVVNLATRVPTGPRALRRRAWRANDRLRSVAATNLAGAATAAGARFVQESFAATYGDHGDAWIDEERPLEPVAQTRTVVDAEAAAERVTAAGGTGVVLRFGLFYGAGSQQTHDLLAAARRGWLMLPGRADAYTTMVAIADAAEAVVAALDLPAGVYHVVEDEPSPLGEHAAVLADLLGVDRVAPLPALLGRVPTLEPLTRSQRISNRKLRSAGAWRPAAPHVRDGWRQVLGALRAGA